MGQGFEKLPKRWTNPVSQLPVHPTSKFFLKITFWMKARKYQLKTNTPTVYRGGQLFPTLVLIEVKNFVSMEYELSIVGVKN